MKIKSVKKIELKDPIPVYDCTVPGLHNFALSNGCIVHNTARNARNPYFQEVLPLMGKPPNVFKEKEKAYANFRVIEMLQSIGYNPKTPGVYRVGRIILLMDADEDGSHISALVLSILLKTVPDLIAAGKVFVVDSNLFQYSLKEGKIMGESLIDLKQKIKTKYPKHVFQSKNVTRFKGWGEAGPMELRNQAFDPKVRKLIRVTSSDETKTIHRVVELMGDSTEARRILLGLTD